MRDPRELARAGRNLPERAQDRPPTGTITTRVVANPATSRLDGIAGGPDGAIWWVDGNSDQIDRMTPAGKITRFNAGISRFAFLWGIAGGYDGASGTPTSTPTLSCACPPSAM